MISFDSLVKDFLVLYLKENHTEACTKFVNLFEQEGRIFANNIFKKWVEMKGERLQTVLTMEQYKNLEDKGNGLKSLDSSSLCEKDDATFLKEFYEWWHKVDSFNTEVKIWLDIMKEIQQRQALFAHVTAELSPCFVYLQHLAETNRPKYEQFAQFARECEKMGIKFSPLAREFLFTVPGIEENTNPLSCVDPTFCVWDRDWNPKMKVTREALENRYSLEKKNESSLLVDLQGLRELLHESFK